ADFPAPTVVVFAGPGGETGKFVTTGAPITVPGEQLPSLSAILSERNKRPIKVTAAFRVPVTVSPKAGDARLDIGQLERQIQVTALGADPKPVTVRGTVRGGV